MRPGELRGNVLEVCHAGDIDPAVRHGHDHVDAAEALHHAAIAALMPGLAQGEAGPLEQCIGVVLETALGRDGDGEGPCHHDSTSIAASSRSVWMAEPTAGTSPGAPTERS